MLTSGQVWLNRCAADGDDNRMNGDLPTYNPAGIGGRHHIDLCASYPGFCVKSDNNGPVPKHRRSLSPRGSRTLVTVDLGGAPARLIFLAYPALQEYLGLNTNLPGCILWRFWRFVTGDCEDDAARADDIPVMDIARHDPDLPNDILLEVKHIIDVNFIKAPQILANRAAATNNEMRGSGRLEWEAASHLDPIPTS